MVWKVEVEQANAEDRKKKIIKGNTKKKLRSAVLWSQGGGGSRKDWGRFKERRAEKLK